MKQKRFLPTFSTFSLDTESYIHNASSIYSKHFVYIYIILRLYIQSTLNIRYILIINGIHIFIFINSSRNIRSCRQLFAYMLPTWCNLLIFSYAVGM